MISPQPQAPAAGHKNAPGPMENLFVGIIAIALLAYLTLAMLLPEKF